MGSLLAVKSGKLEGDKLKVAPHGGLIYRPIDIYIPVVLPLLKAMKEPYKEK